MRCPGSRDHHNLFLLRRKDKAAFNHAAFEVQNFDEIMMGASQLLKKDAWLLMEHGYSQQKKLLHKLASLGYSEIEGCKDYASVDRIVLAKLNLS